MEAVGAAEADGAGDQAGDEESRDTSSHGLRMEQQALWVDIQVQQAVRRGEFDNLPGRGKPIPGIDGPHDPDWWLKSLIERERISGVLPPALALRTEDVQLDTTLDREPTEVGVRRVIDDFNARIVDARRQLQGGPPVITALRDPDGEAAAWAARRTSRTAQQKEVLERIRRAEAASARPPWWRRLLDPLRPSRRRLV